MAHALRAVQLTHVLHHFQAALIVEVHINIGHFRTLRRQKTLKHQPVFERVEGSNVHRVGNNSTCRRTTSRSNANTVLLCPTHVLLHDQKVIGKTLKTNNAILIFKAFLHVNAVNNRVFPILAILTRKTSLTFSTKPIFR